jgi:hypothetical protein
MLANLTMQSHLMMSPDSVVERVCIASKFERMQQACFIIF